MPVENSCKRFMKFTASTDQMANTSHSKNEVKIHALSSPLCRLLWALKVPTHTARSRNFNVACSILTTLICLLQVSVLFCDARTTATEDTIPDDSNEILPYQLRAFWYCSQEALTFPEDAASDEPFCPASFDGYSCWDATIAGRTATVACPSFVPGSDEKQVATRTCLPNGTWARSPITGRDEGDYSACSFDRYYKVDEELLIRLLQEVRKLDESPYDNPNYANALDECVRTVLSKPILNDGHVYCPRTFDLWGCWNDTPAGEVAYIPCPNFVFGFIPERFAHKLCTENGSWFRLPETNRTWSNYTTCVDQDDLSFRQRINKLYIAGYSVSVIALLVSLGIFFYFKSLQCTRITIHKNLFVSFIINNVMWIIWYTEVLDKTDVISNNHWTCQALHVLVHHFMVCNYFWMFCEGLYLHTLLVVAFVAEERILKWFYMLGWGVPTIITVCYAVARSSDEQETKYCWIDESSYMWILQGPVCVSMLMNLIFLINIVGVLVTKLRAVNSPDTHQTRKAVRATLILIPLLGLHYMLTPFRPVPKAPGEAIYETISAIVTSFQVLSLLHKRWNLAWILRGRDRRMSYAATTVSYLPRFSSDIQSRIPLRHKEKQITNNKR